MSSESRWYARRFDATYLEVYAHRDEGEAERATAALLAPLGLQGRRVLDLACGSGRYLAALRRRGARAVGLDLSPDLLRAARQSGTAASELVRGDMLLLPFQAGCFDLVISMFTSFGYFPSPEEDRAVLGEVARVLRPGGDLVLDFLNAVRLRETLVPVSRRRSGRFEVQEIRRLDPLQNLIVKDIELRAPGERHRYREQVRLWSAEELGHAIDQTGLEVLERWGDYAGAAFDPHASERLVVHARRRGGA